jgi:hypothetical protein
MVNVHVLTVFLYRYINYTFHVSVRIFTKIFLYKYILSSITSSLISDTYFLVRNLHVGE